MKGMILQMNGSEILRLSSNCVSRKFKHNFSEYKRKPRCQSIITIKSQGGVHQLPLSDILFIESDSSILDFHLVDGKICSCAGPLKEIEEKLKKGYFWEMNRRMMLMLRSKVSRMLEEELNAAPETMPDTDGEKGRFR